jgi:hypothetical protein
MRGGPFFFRKAGFEKRAAVPSLEFDPMNRDGSHGDGCKYVLLSMRPMFKPYGGGEAAKVCTGLGMTNLVS